MTKMSYWDTAQGRLVTGATLFLALLALWEISVEVSGIQSFLLPAPSAILGQLAAKPGWYIHHAYYTLYETVLGFALAVVTGVLIAVGIVYSRLLDRTLFMLLITMNAVPKIAVAPLFIIWLGTDLKPKIATALLVSIFPIVIATVMGLRSTEPAMLDMAKSMRASRLRILWKIRAPTALPGLFSGLKIGVTLAFTGAIVGEFIAAENGLGYVVVSSQANFATDAMFAAIVLLVVLGLALFYLIEVIEGVLIPWHPLRRRAAKRASQ